MSQVVLVAYIWAELFISSTRKPQKATPRTTEPGEVRLRDLFWD